MRRLFLILPSMPSSRRRLDGEPNERIIRFPPLNVLVEAAPRRRAEQVQLWFPFPSLRVLVEAPPRRRLLTRTAFFVYRPPKSPVLVEAAPRRRRSAFFNPNPTARERRSRCQTDCLVSPSLQHNGFATTNTQHVSGIDPALIGSHPHPCSSTRPAQRPGVGRQEFAFREEPQSQSRIRA